jgi:hypothetical protein
MIVSASFSLTFPHKRNPMGTLRAGEVRHLSRTGLATRPSCGCACSSESNHIGCSGNR